MEVASAALAFLAAAAVIAVGYAAGRLAQATRFPDVPALLLVGLALGPVNRALLGYGYGSPALADALAPERLLDVAPFVSGLALVVILFEAGLGMEARQIRSSLGPALRIAFPVLIVSSGAVAAVGHWVFGMPPVVAVVLGVALSNVGQTVSTALLRRMDLDGRTRSIGLVEMALYDVISVPILVSLFHIAGGTADGGELWGTALRGFAQTASISLVVGGAAGVLWVSALGRLHGHPHSYMLTMAILLAVYAATEELGGAGAVSVLLFGLLVGNRASLLRLLRRRSVPEGEEAKVQEFHEEVAFVVRTAFFLFLGLSFTLGLRDQWPVDSPLPALSALDHQAALFGIGAALVLVALPLGRALVIPAVSGGHREWRGLVPVFGHGLGTAVLATLPFAWHDFRPGTAFHDSFAPWQPVFVNLAFIVILGSVLFSGLLVFVAHRWPGRAPAPALTAEMAAPQEGAGPAPPLRIPPSPPASEAPSQAPPKPGRAKGGRGDAPARRPR
jgi:potassium/hydrogen antiporter